MDRLELKIFVEGSGERGTRIAVAWAAFDAAGTRLADSGERVELDPEWLAFRNEFAPFELSRSFVDSLLALRPARVIVERLAGISLDLARIAYAFGFPLFVRQPETSILDASDRRWVDGLLRVADALLPPADAPASPPALSSVLPPMRRASMSAKTFGYEAYAFSHRDHALLLFMQTKLTPHFEGCREVVDVGCGTGIFLEALTRHGIAAQGVERNQMSARYAQAMGHTVFTGDALDWLEAHPACCDGIYCSHFIEHLPVDDAERLIRVIAGALRPGGRALLVFPDPESIRAQLLGFWRDPEHVRFYHPELVMAFAEVHGLVLEYNSQRNDPRQPGRHVAPFDFAPYFPPPPPARDGWWARFLRALGMTPLAELEAIRARADAHETVLRQLWAVNQTWAWEDNAVLRFQRPG